MQISVSTDNQIIRFMRRMRYVTDRDHEPFPGDICRLTRQFLLFVFLYAVLSMVAGTFFACMTAWPIALLYGFPSDPDSGMWGALLFGGVGWVITAIALIVWARMKAIERGWIRKTQRFARARRRVSEAVDNSLLGQMGRSIKDKTCIRVHIEESS